MSQCVKWGLCNWKKSGRGGVHAAAPALACVMVTDTQVKTDVQAAIYLECCATSNQNGQPDLIFRSTTLQSSSPVLLNMRIQLDNMSSLPKSMRICRKLDHDFP